MQRILIVGTSGSGKTTLAKKLTQLLEIPAYDLDDYYWLPNWQPNPDYLEQQLNQIISHSNWIISGNYSKFKAILWEQADTIIWLDYSFGRCFFQGLRRSLQRILKKETCCNGNYETFRRTFLSTNSLLT